MKADQQRSAFFIFILMIYLLLSILTATLIFIIFKLAVPYKANLLKLITINYVAALMLGLFSNASGISMASAFTSSWIGMALLIGFLFIVMFYFFGLSTREAGMAVTSVAGKMSVSVPIVYSIIWYSEPVGFLKIAGLILALSALFLTVYKPIRSTPNKLAYLLPIVIFAGSGITDSLVKHTQYHYLRNSDPLLFSTFVFFFALIIGIGYIFFTRKQVSLRLTPFELIGGTILGFANFASLYFFILALNCGKIDSSIVFGINNVGIVLLSALSGTLFFKEQLITLNFAGIGLALLAILILMFA